MKFELFTLLSIAALSFGAAGHALGANEALRVSGPVVHDNLAVYFIHGESAEGPAPLTLAEAMAQDRVRLLETGDVNELKIENVGDEPVFIQAGDIVKGGKQDRVLTTSLLLKPKSGEVPLAAYCVEQGRWSSRGVESVSRFAQSTESVPSREGKLAMRAPMATASISANGERRAGLGDRQPSRQSAVWDSVAKTKAKLSAGIREDVASPTSASSLQLALENDKLQAARAAYVEALRSAGESAGDIIGYAFAINGRMNSADVYMSNGLFGKMWEKQLRSAATEAIGEKDQKAETPPSADDVKSFLAEARSGSVQAVDPANANVGGSEVRDSARALYFAASPSAAGRLHESYLAK